MTAAKPRAEGRLPRTVWALGFVSLFMDISSEMIHALLPVFLTVSLGASVAFVGVIEGVAESTAAIARIFSGYASDRFRRRKPFILFGYGLGALSKPFFALAAAPGFVFAARFMDRIGKGVRGAPRDALVADVTAPEMRGRAYGLRQGLDTAGAFIGPLAAIALMALFANDFRAVFWIALAPAALAVLFVVFAVGETPPDRDESAARAPLRLRELERLTPAFWGVAAIGVVFTLARFSEAFLVLRAVDEGLPIALAPVVLVVMNAVYTASAYPAGAWSDRANPRLILLSGLAALVGADLVLAFSSGVAGALFGVALWGAHMALTQGLFAKLVADCAPASLRGSAFGVFHLLTGLALLAASIVAGLVWDKFGAEATFLTGAGFAIIAGAMLAARRD